MQLVAAVQQQPKRQQHVAVATATVAAVVVVVVFVAYAVRVQNINLIDILMRLGWATHTIPSRALS